ncbi:hypothetical protein HN011_011004 [Eciton burchellii]|nr:hypothetical protein HN011_011004 [Eciton burchellii]
MFRQIMVEPKDADFQRILWRPTPESSLQHYRHVTYGLAPAPYLAMRVLQQLASDDGHRFPAAGPTHRPDEGRRIPIAKVGSQFTDSTGRHPCQYELTDHFLAKDKTLKILGLSWLPREDVFCFVIATTATAFPIRRSILSFVAKLYDPLGWAAPVVITVKILLQELWLLKNDWDTPIPPELVQRWKIYVDDLPHLARARVPRWTGQRKENSSLELHGFVNASSRAYAAVVYLTVIHSESNFQVSLICAKTKVAPVKTISIPRLELNAVMLLSRLLVWTQQVLSLSSVSTYGWTDSTIILAWLQQHPSKWTTYVANSVSEVQTALSGATWHYVPSKENPADFASRGLSASMLLPYDLWWNDPAWLRRSSTIWPKRDLAMSVDETASKEISTEARKVIVQHVDCTLEAREKFEEGDTARSVRVTRRRSSMVLTRPKSPFFEGVERAARADPHSSVLKALKPILGEGSLFRLGGRLHNAPLDYDEKHPIILPKHRISELLIDCAHRATLHGGTQLMLHHLRQRYWIIGSRNLVKAHIRRCVTCARQAAKASTQLMGNLPEARVNPSLPFSHTGVDYAGPFGIIPFVGRGQRIRKHYVALFVCLATKAIHLEVAEDYSTAGFLAAFRRFVSRRGLPTHMYSDNGLWEASVKSFKFHLRRVIGSRTLSKAEFATILCQIEACLNSRPIAALSDDPGDLSALTPGHFLIGRPLLSVSEESVLEINEHRLSRWQLVQAIQEQIWRSWAKDYLHSLQVRNKWSTSPANIKINDLVIVRNPQLPPSRWELARVIQVHPGSDGHIRMVTLRTACGHYKRPITQICKLPVSSKKDALENNSSQNKCLSCTSRCLTPFPSHCKRPFFVQIMFLRLPRVANGIILVSVLGCHLRFGYEAGGMFKILIDFILCLEFWTLGKTQCKQCVRHASMISPRVGDVGHTVVKKKSIAFSSTITRRLYPQCCARHPRQRSLASE